MDTTAKGDRLRDDVFSLLEAAGKHAVSRERNIAGKKSDVYYEEQAVVPGKTLRIAVECKNYDAVLTRTDFDVVHAAYLSARAKFDHLIIVTEKGTASSVLETIESIDWISHELYVDFCSRLLDFKRYLHGLKALFSKDGLDEFYEPVLDTDGRSIESRIDTWLDGPLARPQAILAGYGMGKTSFAIRLAHKYAQIHLGGKISRIPIYIRLGDLSSEQNIEGLICRHFVKEHVVNGFNYDLFASFNRKGRFIIILDGFDEMKHAMTFDAFEYNIAQLRSLITERSRVILLGRPNAFLSEDERAAVLHGVEKIGSERVKNAEVADFEEIEVSLFNGEQLERFVGSCLRYVARVKASRDGQVVDEETIERRASEILDPRYRRLLSRPVHARMMVTIALSTNSPLESFSRYDLYRKFFENILQREQTKFARTGVGETDRIRFMRIIAWIALVGGDSRSITTGTLRQALKMIGVQAPSDGQLREFAIGSVLETKPPDLYYFAHRSFLEFLCTEYLLDAAVTPSSLTQISNFANEEIFAFLSESGRAEAFARSVLEVLSNYSGPISHSLLAFLAKVTAPTGPSPLNVPEGLFGAGPVLVHIMSLGSFPLETIERDLYEGITSLRDTPSKLALVLAVCQRVLLSEKGTIEESQIVEFDAAMIGALHLLARDVMLRRCEVRSGGTAAAESEGLIWTKLLVGSVSAHFEREELRGLTLSVGELAGLAESALEEWLSIDVLGYAEEPERTAVRRPDFTRTLRLDSSFATDREREEVDRRERQLVADFWRTRPVAADFVSISTQVNPRRSRDSGRRLSLPGR